MKVKIEQYFPWSSTNSVPILHQDLRSLTISLFGECDKSSKTSANFSWQWVFLPLHAAATVSIWVTTLGACNTKTKNGENQPSIYWVKVCLTAKPKTYPGQATDIVFHGGNTRTLASLSRSWACSFEGSKPCTCSFRNRERKQFLSTWLSFVGPFLSLVLSLPLTLFVLYRSFSVFFSSSLPTYLSLFTEGNDNQPEYFPLPFY